MKKVNLIFKANGTLQLSKEKNVLTGKKMFFPSTNPRTVTLGEDILVGKKLEDLEKIRKIKFPPNLKIFAIR